MKWPVLPHLKHLLSLVFLGPVGVVLPCLQVSNICWNIFFISDIISVALSVGFFSSWIVTALILGLEVLKAASISNARTRAWLLCRNVVRVIAFWISESRMPSVKCCAARRSCNASGASGYARCTSLLISASYSGRLSLVFCARDI